MHGDLDCCPDLEQALHLECAPNFPDTCSMQPVSNNGGSHDELLKIDCRPMSEFYVHLHALAKAHETEMSMLRQQISAPRDPQEEDSPHSAMGKSATNDAQIDMWTPQPHFRQTSPNEASLAPSTPYWMYPPLSPFSTVTGSQPDGSDHMSMGRVGSLDNMLLETTAAVSFELHQMWRRGSRKLMPSHLRRDRAFNSCLSECSDKALERDYAYNRRFILHPNSHARLAWDIASMTLLTYDILVIPFVSAFDPHPTTIGFILNCGTMLFWTLDIVMSFLTGFQTARNCEMRLHYIAVHYLRTWLLVDIGIVGLDWYLAVMDGSDQTGNTARLGRSLRSLRFMRTLRLLRVLKLKRLIQVIQDLITTEFVSICWGITKVVLCLVVANHIVACTWYAIGSAKFGDNWIEANDIEVRSLAYQYATAVHWSLTQFTPASMEVFPQNTVERVFAVCVLLMALITFSSFVSMLTTSMSQLRQISSNESRQFWLLRRYLRDWRIPRHTSSRIQHYLEYAYQRSQKRVQPRDIFLLSLLSEPLKEELRHEILKQHVAVHPLFKVGMNTTRSFSKSLSESSLASGDVLFSCSEEAKSMVFVSNGTMEYTIGRLERPDGMTSPESKISGNTRKFSQSVHRLQYVSEPVLWCTWLHVGDMIAITESSVVSVDSGAFGQSLSNNQPVWTAVKRYARKYVNELNRVPKEDLTDLLSGYICSATMVDEADFVNPLHTMDDQSEQDSRWTRLITRAVYIFRGIFGTSGSMNPHRDRDQNDEEDHSRL